MNEPNPAKRYRVRPAPPLDALAHKGRAGHVLCFAGSETMPGAAILILRAAQRAGAGLVTLATFDGRIIYSVAAAVPEAVYLDLSRSRDVIERGLPPKLVSRSDHVRVVGPGLGQGERTADLVQHLAEDEFKGPMVLDADALNVLGSRPEALAARRGPLVITPHPGEAARLTGVKEIPEDDEGRLECAGQIARSAKAFCVLKGHRTIVTDGERSYVNPTGNPGMATAGAGDVLVGILGAYLASATLQGSETWGIFDAICASVYLHGLAGDLAAAELGQRAVIASSLVDFLSAAQRELEEKGPR